MKPLPTQTQGHLIVAAMRILAFRDGRPPTDLAIAELLGLPREEIAHWARGLERHGVIEVVESAFDVRYEILDHTLLETLPEKEGAPPIKEEVEAYHKKAKERRESLEHLFGEDPSARAKSRASKIEEELKKYKSSGRARSPFDPPPGDDDAPEQ